MFSTGGVGWFVFLRHQQEHKPDPELKPQLGNKNRWVIRDRNTFLIKALVDGGGRRDRDKRRLLKRDAPGDVRRAEGAPS